MPNLLRTIVRPIVTEKSSAAYQDRGEYTFECHPHANKHAIKQAIESLFGVQVIGVWTSQQRGKLRRVGGWPAPAAGNLGGGGGKVRPAAALEEGHREAEGRRHDRDL
jgi:large subunit ribosomal protein L23